MVSSWYEPTDRGDAQLLELFPGEHVSDEGDALAHIAIKLLRKDGRLPSIVEEARRHQEYATLCRDVRRTPPRGLMKHELIWAALYPFVEERGYRLPKRFSPGWRAYWLDWGPRDIPLDILEVMRMPEGPDVQEHHIRHVPAVQLDNGDLVFMKMMGSFFEPHTDDEFRIHSLLSSWDWLAMPGNHVMPILDAFAIPPVPELFYSSGPSQPPTARVVVFPRLRRVSTRLLQRVGYGLAVARQALEGLAFLHRHGVAHCDISMGNLLVTIDGPPFHLYLSDFETASVPPLDQLERIDPLRRTRRQRRLLPTSGIWAMTFRPPEVTGGDVFDPFKLDVAQMAYTFDLVFKRIGWCGHAFGALRAAMECPDPSRRPTAAECVGMFDEAVAKIPFMRRLAYTSEEEERGRKKYVLRKAREAVRSARLLVRGFDH